MTTPTTNLQKGSWSLEEDEKLTSYINKYGIWNWSQMPRFAGLSRSGKSCRLRWMNYLKPNIKRGNFSKEEDEIILHSHSLLGNRWSLIASRLPGRTDNDVKNYWHSHLKKRATEYKLTTEQNDMLSSPGDEVDESRANYFDMGSPGTSDDLHCFWDQLCTVENLDLGNNIHRNMFLNSSFQDSYNDPINSTYNFYSNDYDTTFMSDS